MIHFLNHWLRGALAVVLSFLMIAPATAALYTDVGGHWAQSAIEALSQQGIIAGYPNGAFRPEGLITRAEFAAMLVNSEDWSGQVGGSTFRDVPPSHWAYRAIEAAAEHGAIRGYPGGYFRPERNISRAEVMTILVNAAEVPLPSATETNQILSRFNDANQVPAWARQHVAAAIESGIFANEPGRTSLIDASVPATRAEVAVMTGNRLDVAITPNTGRREEAVREVPSTLYGRVSIVPANTQFTAVAMSNFGSEISRVGDPVRLVLDQPLVDGSGNIVAPAGSQVIGQVVFVDEASFAGEGGEVVVNFTEIMTPDGKVYPISAEFAGDAEGEISGSTRRGRIGEAALRVLGGAALGAGIGAAIGGIRGGGRADDYLVRGAIIGGGVGAASSLVNRGDEVVIYTGERLPLRLRQPLTVTLPVQQQ